MVNLLKATLVLSITISSMACQRIGAPVVTAQAETPRASDAAGANPEAGGQAQQAPVRFESYAIRGAKSVAELKARLGAEGFNAVLKINRVDPKHLHAGLVLVVPDTTDLARLSPFPMELEAAKSIPKLILVSRREQAFAAYESGALVMWGPTSTGKRATQTPAGLYHTNWRARETRSSVNRNWVLPWCFNLNNVEAIAFHQYDLPGYPASHGCVRLLAEDAQWIYNWADQWVLAKASGSRLAYGTAVVIFGDYDYTAQPSWKSLPRDSSAASVSAEEINKALGKYLPDIQSRADARTRLLASL